MIACVFISMAFAKSAPKKEHTFLGSPVEGESMKEEITKTKVESMGFTGGRREAILELAGRVKALEANLEFPWIEKSPVCQTLEIDSLEIDWGKLWKMTSGQYESCKCGADFCKKGKKDEICDQRGSQCYKKNEFSLIKECEIEKGANHDIKWGGELKCRCGDGAICDAQMDKECVEDESKCIVTEDKIAEDKREREMKMSEREMREPWNQKIKCTYYEQEKLCENKICTLKDGTVCPPEGEMDCRCTQYNVYDKFQKGGQ